MTGGTLSQLRRVERETESSLQLALLKSWDFVGWRNRYGRGQELPYRIDLLQDMGFDLRWTDRLHSPSWTGSTADRIVRRLESRATPFAQSLIMAPDIVRSDVVLAFFESEANSYAALRALARPVRRKPFVVITCWLAHVLSNASRTRIAAYRRMYRSVDLVYYLSKNQGAILADLLEIDDGRLRYLPFGVDTERFMPREVADERYVLAVGRDRGRDWETLFNAASGLDVPVKVCCRPKEIEGIPRPDNVEVLGYVELDRYQALLAHATVVAVAAKPVIYPSGQSVLLEAMSSGRAIVATGTEALDEYLEDGVNCLVVPPGDADALRDRIVEALADESLRGRLSEGARQAVEMSFSARTMWATVAGDLSSLATGSPDGEA